MIAVILGTIAAPFVVAMIYFTAIFLYNSWLFREFRGPLALPFIGNCYTAAAINYLKYLADQRKKYGKVFVFYALWKAKLIVMDPIVARRILSDSKTFPKGEDYTYRFAVAFGQGLVTSNGDKHKKDRSIFGKYFVRGNIVRYVNLINEIVDDSIQEMESASTEQGRPKPVDVEHFFAIVALRVFMMFALNTNYKHDHEREKKICRLVSRGSEEVGNLIAFGLPMWRSLPMVQSVVHARNIIASDFMRILEERKEVLARGEGQDIDDCFSVMIKEQLSYEEMTDHFMTLICAGHDTTAFFSAYLVYSLAKYPDIQEKLRKEIVDHFKGRNHVTADDLVELKYLAKVMQETLRVYAVIPFVGRTCVEDTHIKESNVTIPKGVQIMIPLSLINRDPTVWENPAVFNPDRFEGKATDFTSAKNGFFPFGYGTRTCIGNTFAQIESGIFICKLLMRFRFEPDPGYKMKIQAGISLTTKDGINVIVKPL